MATDSEILDELSPAYEAMAKAVRRFKNADTELRRAENAGDPIRLNKAGTAYAIAKINLMKLDRL
jgi:hypothetical protein